MMEGRLYVSSIPGSYAIGSTKGPLLNRGQTVEILLGDQWIPGHIAYSSDYPNPSDSSAVTWLPRSIGAYSISSDEASDTVTESSEESFPASDSPAWTAPSSPQLRAAIVNGYYFIADADDSICGLCIGMQVRTK